MLQDKLTQDIAEVAKKILAKEVEEPRAKGEKDFKSAHKVKKDDKTGLDKPKVTKPNMAEGKMKELHALVSKGIKDPKKITKELGLPNTKEVHKAIASLVAGMKENVSEEVDKQAILRHQDLATKAHKKGDKEAVKFHQDKIRALRKNEEEELDPVNRKAVVKKFKDRKDKDIDNDGDVDSSDKYLHKRRQAISKATSKDESKKKLAAESFANFDPTPSELDEACEYILENGTIDHLSDEQLDEVLATVAKGIGAVAGVAGKMAKAGGKLAVKGAQKAADRLSTKGRADAAEKKAKEKEQKNADRERLARAKERIKAAKDKAKEEKEKTKAQKQRVKDSKKKADEEKRERQAREREAAQKKQQSESTQLEEAKEIKLAGKPFTKITSKGKNKTILFVAGGDPMSISLPMEKVIEIGKDVGLWDGKKVNKKAIDGPDAWDDFDYQVKLRGGKIMGESTQLDEKNDALYLIYKDKITAMKVNNYIKKTYRGKAESEFAPMDAKNFGVSVFADRIADKIQKDVTKKFGKPDDFMLEKV